MLINTERACHRTMTSPAPKVMIARPSRSNGVLAIQASATQKKPTSAPESHAPRAAAARMKLIIRRLAPGLTQPEFEEALGREWKVNGGKVDWAVYKQGKVSKEYGNILSKMDWICLAKFAPTVLPNLRGPPVHTCI